jgi:hypothetical protein
MFGKKKMLERNGRLCECEPVDISSHGRLGMDYETLYGFSHHQRNPGSTLICPYTSAILLHSLLGPWQGEHGPAEPKTFKTALQCRRAASGLPRGYQLVCKGCSVWCESQHLRASSLSDLPAAPFDAAVRRQDCYHAASGAGKGVVEKEADIFTLLLASQGLKPPSSLPGSRAPPVGDTVKSYDLPSICLIHGS